MDRSPSPGRRVAQLKPEDSVNDSDFETRKDVVALSAVLLVFLLPLGLHHLESGHQIAEEFELQVLVPFPFEDQLFVVLHPGCDPQPFFKALEDVPLTSAGRAVGSADCLVAVAGPAVGDAVLVLMESEPIAFGTLDLFRGGVPFTSLADYSAHDGGGLNRGRITLTAPSLASSGVSTRLIATCRKLGSSLADFFFLPAPSLSAS